MKKIITQKLHEQVFESIKDMVKAGTYKKGDFLPSENALVEMLGVSRVTVRQALKKLAEVGIIETRKGKGSIVAVEWKDLLNEGEMRNVSEEYQNTFFASTQARRILEPVIARQAASSATQEDLAQMEAALSSAEEKMVLSPLMGGSSKRVDFHTCMWRSLHNPVLMETWKNLEETTAQIDKLPLVPPIYRQQQSEEALRQHRAIFEAIRRRDGDYAYYYMLVHCDWILETYGQYFKDFLK